MVKPERKTRTTLETIEFDRREIEKWASPTAIQRELRINDKVRQLATQIEETAVIPGVLTLGRIVGAPTTYLLDGQHRRAAFLMTKHDVGYADVRVHTFDDMAEMGQEFVHLNTALVRLKPDDVLRAMEGSTAGLKTLRKACPWIGYDQVRRGERAPILSMSLVLRAWYGSAPEVPASSTASALELAGALTAADAADCASFNALCYEAWGRGDETRRLYGALNLTICAWAYRRLVLNRARGVSRYVVLSPDEFKRCLMGLSASDDYIDWLLGRSLGDRHRSPCYERMKTIFARRIMADRKTDVRPKLPQPSWAHASGGPKTAVGGA